MQWVKRKLSAKLSSNFDTLEYMLSMTTFSSAPSQSLLKPAMRVSNEMDYLNIKQEHSNGPLQKVRLQLNYTKIAVKRINIPDSLFARDLK